MADRLWIPVNDRLCILSAARTDVCILVADRLLIPVNAIGHMQAQCVLTAIDKLC
jgi:hypothetical protein